VLIALNKPYLVHCKFTDDEVPPGPTLAGLGLPPRVYVAGRLEQPLHDAPRRQALWQVLPSHTQA
jgi:hypothetical protein